MTDFRNCCGRTLTIHALLMVLFAAAGSPGGARAGLGDCSQPVTNGPGPLASDCLFILRSAVGLFTCEPACVCDTNGAGGVLASDAQLCLRKAVGQTVELACNCASTTTTTTTTTSVTIVLGPELLVNGDFELPVQANPENGWGFAGLDGAAGWKTSDGNPGAHFTLNQSGDPSSDPVVSQTVTGLTMGAWYRIGGDYRSFAPGFGDPAKPDAFAVEVQAGGGGASTVVLELPRPSPDPTTWTAFVADFEAPATSITLSFSAERDGDDSSFDVDNLSLRAH